MVLVKRLCMGMHRYVCCRDSLLLAGMITKGVSSNDGTQQTTEQFALKVLAVKTLFNSKTEKYRRSSLNGHVYSEMKDDITEMVNAIVRVL